MKTSKRCMACIKKIEQNSGDTIFYCAQCIDG